MGKEAFNLSLMDSSDAPTKTEMPTKKQKLIAGYREKTATSAHEERNAKGRVTEKHFGITFQSHIIKYWR